MKRKLMAILGLLCALVLTSSLTACFGDPVTFSLDSSNFNSVVAYDQAIDYNDFVIYTSEGEAIRVRPSMVTGWNTKSVGDKTLTVIYEDMIATVNYTVKYKVDFIVDGQAVSTQYVLSASELESPAGYVFELPAEVSDNMELVGVKDETPVEVTIAFGEGADSIPVGAQGVNVPVTVTGTSDWTVTASNDNLSIRKMSGMILVEANKVGVTQITVAAGDQELSKDIVIMPDSLTINESAKTYGIENVYTIGRTNVGGAVSKNILNASCAKAGEGFAENLTWTSSSAKATINNGEITLAQGVGSEIVTFTAEFFGVKASFDVRCVYDGVNVNTYADLYTATKAEKAIVLGADIAFPTNVAEIKYETIHTTYDDTYYANIGKQSEATIKVLLQFKNDLYGNGYEINAHNATLGLLDATGALTSNSIFRGPLDFVALTESGSSAASVKGQDNVCFGIYEGVTVNNVILKAANLEKDLSELLYAGTTVEVFGDNVTIEYSRIMNGRTVLRVFGDANDANKVITLNVKNCVLSGAREFILRMGSNKFVDAIDDENYSPFIGGTSLNLIDIKKGKADEKPANYEKDYIKTFVNVSNTVFKDAGIFAVGIDSHFAGKALHDGTTVRLSSTFEGLNYWKNLAKTSYGAKLTFNGEVKMYNWKKIEDIDSSSLIEINEGLLGDDKIIAMLTLDIGGLIDAASENKAFSTIVSNGYVHAGIAFFGGGKNYGLFEDNANTNLEGFAVSLKDVDVDKAALETAAGTEPFYFNIYDNTTSVFTPEMQESMSDADMYACIYNK